MYIIQEEGEKIMRFIQIREEKEKGQLSPKGLLAVPWSPFTKQQKPQVGEC